MMLDQLHLHPQTPEALAEHIRTVPDFPKPGIAFKDITPLLAHPQAFAELISRMSHAVQESKAECIVGLESRGFIIGVAIAHELGLPFIPARKPGKLPAETIRADYELEYGSATLEIHSDSIREGQRVAIVDDLLATGGTAEAASCLVRALGGVLSGYFFAIELKELKGADRLVEGNV
ncbi:MAG: adenine phosphoribosyltransferase, partial [Bdellovibrionales bacterium]|nr:adenine phosphoribosyltransferase [Bdellovibrionales bacterium]